MFVQLSNSHIFGKEGRKEGRPIHLFEARDKAFDAAFLELERIACSKKE
jgi:hypothetical protein